MLGGVRWFYLALAARSFILTRINRHGVVVMEVRMNCIEVRSKHFITSRRAVVIVVDGRVVIITAVIQFSRDSCNLTPSPVRTQANTHTHECQDQLRAELTRIWKRYKFYSFSYVTDSDSPKIEDTARVLRRRFLESIVYVRLWCSVAGGAAVTISVGWSPRWYHVTCRLGML